LKPAENEFERKAALAGRANVAAHATHTGQTLLCQLGTALLLGTREIECSCRAVHGSTRLRAM